MRRLLVWTWKEWRDRRAILAGIAAAIPAVTALAFLSFTERFRAAALGSRGVRLDAEVGTFSRIFFVVALAMVAFAVASDLFGADRRVGGLALPRRLPRGLVFAFAGKVVFLLAVMAAALLWQASCLSVAWASVGLPDAASRTWELLADAEPFWVPALAVVGTLWVVLASAWLTGSGAAVGAALLLLGALLVPGGLLLRAHPYLAGPLLAHAGTALLLVGALPLVAAAASFLRGARFHRGPWAAAWRGLAVVLVAFGGTYAYAARWLSDFLAFTPGQADVRIYDGILGSGGRYLYLNAYRGPPVGAAGGPHLATPLRPFVLDLETGVVRPLDDHHAWVGHVAGAVGRGGGLGWRDLEPAPVVVARRTEDNVRVGSMAWIDGATATLRRVLPVDFQGPDVAAWSREGLRATSRVTTPHGRRAWLRVVDDQGRRVFETEDGPVSSPPPPADRLGFAWWEMPGGWYGPAYGGGRTSSLVLDAATGRTREVRGVDSQWFLSPSHALRREPSKRATHPVGSILLRDLATGEDSLVGDPDTEPWFVVTRDLVLARRPAETGARHVLWNPRTGAQTPVRFEGIEAARVLGVALLGRGASDDRHAVRLTLDGASIPLAVLERATATIRVLSSPRAATGDDVLEPLAFTADGAVLAVEDETRILRLGPAPGAREVLLPR